MPELKKRGELRTRLSEKYGNQAQCRAGEMTVIQGDRRVTVYGCRRILHYSPTQIRLCVGKREVTVTGECLFCQSFCAGAVTVCGYIGAVLLEAKRRMGGET